MKKRGLLLSSLLILTVTLFCLFLLFFSLSGFLPLKPNCLPITYPDGRLLEAENGKVTTYTVEKPIQDVTAFFDQSLRESENINRKWERVRFFMKNATLFVCTSAANAYEAERGCIYLEQTEKVTVITSVWSHFPDNAPACSYYIGALTNK